jgi:hypothetical protein
MTQWFRFYGDAINDPKILKLPEVTRWRWVALLSAASKNNGIVPAADDLALMLRLSMQHTLELITTLEKANLIDKTETGYAPHNWMGRQYKIDGADPTAAQRNKRYRDRLRNERNVTHRNDGNVTASDDRNETAGGDRNGRVATVSVTRPDTEADTETEQNRPEKKEPRASALGPPGWPVDFFEQFWGVYPSKVDKAGALKALTRVGNKGAVPWQTIMDGLNRYIAKTDDRPWCNPTTWIDQSRWEEQHATVRSNNGFRIGNTRRAGHDAILASATRKARKLDQQDGLAWSENQTELAERIDADRDRACRDGAAFGSNQRDHHGIEFEHGGVLEGEIIAPDENAARVPDVGQLF